MAATAVPARPPAARHGEDGSAPGPWLRELVHLKPAPWSWGQAIRSAIGIGVPATLGFLYDATLPALWCALGAMMATAAEPAGTYRAKFHQMGIAAAIGTFGFFAGWLFVLPWIAVVAVMAAAGFVAGIVSSWGSKFSLGAMQFLLVASIALGIPHLAPFSQPALLFAAGAVFQIALLAIEALVVRDRPERARIAALVRALAALAAGRAAWVRDQASAGLPADAAARRAVTDALAALGTDSLTLRSRIVGRSTEADAMAALVARADVVFARILAESDGEVLARSAATLGALAEPIARGRHAATPDAAAASALETAVADFAATATLGASGSALDGYVAAAEPPRTATGSASLAMRMVARMTPGASVLRSATALALCMGIAYAARWLPLGEHWFWVPLTVTLVMKPDLGSIFARAVLRAIGTVGGAALGVALMAFVPKDLAMAAAMAVLGLFLPWSMRPSYAVQAVVLTPLVLILIGSISPVTQDAHLAVNRILDTGLGSAIVLVFGYFIWPRRHASELGSTFHSAKEAVSAYLRALAVPGESAAASARSRGLRRSAYGALSDFRHHLEVLVVEPPPASREAVAWFPLVATLERICDRVTAYAGAPPRRLAEPDVAPLAVLADRIVMPPGDRTSAPPIPTTGSDAAVAALVEGVGGELDHMARIQADGRFPEAPSGGP